MQPTRTLMIVKSIHHQNTAKVAESIASILHADVRTPEDVTPEIIKDYDLVGFGSGIYFGRFHPKLRRCVHQLRVTTSHRPVFIFSTAGLSFLSRVWHWCLKHKLSRKGYDVLGEFSCRGFDTVGPLWLMGGLNRGHPNETDLAHATQFAQRLLEVMQNSYQTLAVDVTSRSPGDD